MPTLEELKKSFIKDEENFEEKELVALLEKMNKICQLDKKGYVSFNDSNLSDKEKIKYILSARFLANKLDASIKKEVTNEELENMIKASKPQIRARLSDLRKEDIILDLEKDSHVIKLLFLHKIFKNG